jgi:hypothetical protein
MTEMMPEAYVALLPPIPAPDYKYTSDGAGESMKNYFLYFIGR